MDTVIKQISEIEAAASSVMENANAQKKAFAQEMAERTEAFDKQLEAETRQKTQALRSRMELEMDSKLSKQKADAKAQLQHMEQIYQAHHTEYAEALFQSLIKE